jgi:hypothetical protein
VTVNDIPDLHVTVVELAPVDPYDGDCVMFVKRDQTRLHLICRRFEGGRLRDIPSFARDPHATEISTAELSLLLEGASFTVHQRADAWRKPRRPTPTATGGESAVPQR